MPVLIQNVRYLIYRVKMKMKMVICHPITTAQEHCQGYVLVLAV